METTTYKEIMERPNRRNYRKGVYCEPLMRFIESSDGTLKYSFTNRNEASQCGSAVRQFIKKHDLNLVVWSRYNDIYVIKG